MSHASRVGKLARMHRELRGSGHGPRRHAIAVFVGVFIGCLPLFGLHFPLCLLVSRLLKLNILTTYLAAHVNNPLSAPFLIMAEIELGAMLRRGEFWGLRMMDLDTIEWRAFFGDLVLGSLVLGLILGVVLALFVWLTLWRGNLSFQRWELVLRVSDRFLPTGIGNWEFVRGKLRWDPLYLSLLDYGAFEAGGTMVDLGCGRGIVLGLALEAGGEPKPERFIGIEGRRRTVESAQLALPEAEILQADLREVHLPAARTVFLLDVLHYMPHSAQEGLLDRVTAALEPGGRLILREADADAGMAFFWTRLAEWLRALLRWSWPSFHFRSRQAWRQLLEERGYRVIEREGGTGTPFANDVFIAEKSAKVA